jgi:hypothetical protein
MQSRVVSLHSRPLAAIKVDESATSAILKGNFNGGIPMLHNKHTATWSSFQ